MRSKVTARGPDGTRADGKHHLFQSGAFGRASSIRTSIEDESGRCPMRNHDLVSDGFLALTAGGLVLLCSSLVALAFA
jgi:hypothetical protein